MSAKVKLITLISTESILLMTDISLYQSIGVVIITSVLIFKQCVDSLLSMRKRMICRASFKIMEKCIFVEVVRFLKFRTSNSKILFFFFYYLLLTLLIRRVWYDARYFFNNIMQEAHDSRVYCDTLKR